MVVLTVGLGLATEFVEVLLLDLLLPVPSSAGRKEKNHNITTKHHKTSQQNITTHHKSSQIITNHHKSSQHKTSQNITKHHKTKHHNHNTRHHKTTQNQQHKTSQHNTTQNITKHHKSSQNNTKQHKTSQHNTREEEREKMTDPRSTSFVPSSSSVASSSPVAAHASEPLWEEQFILRLPPSLAEKCRRDPDLSLELVFDCKKRPESDAKDLQTDRSIDRSNDQTHSREVGKVHGEWRGLSHGTRRPSMCHGDAKDRR